MTNDKFRKNNKSTGYTIIEILVVLSIAGIIFGSGFVSFRDFSRRQALVGAGRNLKGDLRLAQSYSLVGKKPADSNCDETKTLNGYHFYVSSLGQYVIKASCSGVTVDVKTVDLAADVEISSPSPNPIVFKALGEGTNVVGTTTITLSQPATGHAIITAITQGGEIK